MPHVVNIAGTVNDSIVDGPGIRFAVFAQGCSHACPGCHNPQTHPFNIGTNVSIDELIAKARANPLVKGVTLTGGDPFFQADGFALLAKALKGLGYEVAAYTGFTWEELMQTGSKGQKELLKHIDILVDGRYSESERNLELRFRGSENQRIIDVPQSLEGEAPILCTAKRWIG